MPSQMGISCCVPGKSNVDLHSTYLNEHSQCTQRLMETVA